MISDTAKETIDGWKAEGLAPTFEDCIRLNALGLKIERGESAAELAALPRMAFLGDLILWEPTIAVRQWLDAASRVVAADYFSQLTLTSFALNTPAAELPRLDRVSDLVRETKRFADECLAPFTESQILAAVSYALKGDDPTEDEDAEPTVAEKEARRKCREIPQAMKSAARRVFAEACSLGVPDAERFTVPALDAIITSAIALKGGGAFKGENGRATADFYRTADVIYERLQSERRVANNRDEPVGCDSGSASRTKRAGATSESIRK